MRDGQLDRLHERGELQDRGGTRGHRLLGAKEEGPREDRRWRSPGLLPREEVGRREGRGQRDQAVPRPIEGFGGSVRAELLLWQPRNGDIFP